MDALRVWMLRCYVDAVAGLHRRAAAGGRDRGDVPGWVLVTIMTAGLVTMLWAVAGERLQTILSEALDGVTGPGT